MSREYNKAMNALRFSPAAKKRMEAYLVASQDQVQNKQARAGVFAQRGGKLRWRTAAVGAAAVVLVVGVAGGAYASGALMGMGNIMDDLFGGPPAQTEVVNQIGRPVGASATSNGVTVTAEAIIGARSNYVMVFSIAKDDGSAFEGVTPLNNGALPLGFEGPATTHIDGVNSSGGAGYFYDADPSDNTIQYVERESVTESDGSIVGRTARVNLHNLYRYGDDGSRQLIATGTWNMKFTVDYEDTSIDLSSGQSFGLNGGEATLDSASISPLAFTFSYTVDEALDLQGQNSGRMSDSATNEVNRFLNPSLALHMKDGTTVDIDTSRSAGGTREEDGRTICTKNIVFDKFLNLDQVASITLGGRDIALR